MDNKKEIFNPIQQLGIQVLKRKERMSDNEKVTLFVSSDNPNMWVLCHQDKDNNVLDIRTYQWALDKKTERQVKLLANREFSIWRKFLMLHVSDFEMGMIAFHDLV